MINKFLILFITLAITSCSQFSLSENGQNAIIIDVRSVTEFNAGHLKSAINIPHDEIKNKIANYTTDKDAHITVYCRSGRRSEIATTYLIEMGYKNSHNAGGYQKLKALEDK